jgi:hypothetical protein
MTANDDTEELRDEIDKAGTGGREHGRVSAAKRQSAPFTSVSLTKQRPLGQND